MRVESSRVFSILAHELRSPLGVIQGYVRMLRMRRADDDPEIRMLTAMLEATGRIAAAARHASELATWHDDMPAGEASDVPIGALIERALADTHLPPTISVESLPAAAGHLVRTSQPAALAAALTTLVIAAGRQAPEARLRVSARPDHEATVVVIGPELEVDGLSPELIAAADPHRAADRLFGSGGQGLALVLAACVFDRHRIGVGLVKSASDVIVLRLPKD